MEHIFTDQNFEERVLKSPKPVLVDFWAPWCGPCRVMSPIIDEIAGELEGRLTVGKMNVDEHPNYPGQYGIMSIPTFLVFKGGQVAEQMVGTMSKEDMLNTLQKHLG
ncbi:thioredoxin [Candidatus Uhrbacteria bacterium UHB]|nr:thioredoxin [Candidatus Uhrbacteria bacterium UHB]RIL00725.1 MAG: thioredoxin [Candidatus Uhrbacteria bacterium]